MILADIPAPTPRPFTGTVWDWLELVAWSIAFLILVGFAIGVFYSFRKGAISLTGIIAEPDGKASLSRFQALLFTFVFVIAVGLIVMRTGQFPTALPLPVLALLGGSLGTYLASKGIQRGLGSGDSGGVAATNDDSNAGTNGQTSPTTSGPVIRLGKNASTVLRAGLILPPSVPLPTTGESQFLILAGKNRFGQQVTVATAIADVNLTISTTATGLNGGQVEYLPAGASATQTQTFFTSITIQTDPNTISDVKVQWNANADGVIVTTIVS